MTQINSDFDEPLAIFEQTRKILVKTQEILRRYPEKAQEEPYHQIQGLLSGKYDPDQNFEGLTISSEHDKHNDLTYGQDELINDPVIQSKIALEKFKKLIR